MSAPLTKDQKRYLAKLSREAWRAAGAELDGMDESDFRRQEVARVCGKLGLRCCSQDDYGSVKGHFLDRLGKTRQAFAAVHRGEGNARRVAEYKLVQACEGAGLALAYAGRICAQMFKCGLEDASEDQLWKLMFTIKNRGRKVTYQEESMA